MSKTISVDKESNKSPNCNHSPAQSYVISTVVPDQTGTAAIINNIVTTERTPAVSHPAILSKRRVVSNSTPRTIGIITEINTRSDVFFPPIRVPRLPLVHHVVRSILRTF